MKTAIHSSVTFEGKDEIQMLERMANDAVEGTIRRSHAFNDDTVTRTSRERESAYRNLLEELRAAMTILSSFLLAVTLSASPITHAPIAEQPMQYWHTQWVPSDGGVYLMEVYAPALPKVEPEPYVFVDIGDPPRLTETPEPGTLHFALATVAIFLCGFKCGFIAKACTCEKREIAWKALEEDPHA